MSSPRLLPVFLLSTLGMAIAQPVRSELPLPGMQIGVPATTLMQRLSTDEPPQRWQLVFFHPFRPGVLSQCENAHQRGDFDRVAHIDPDEPQKAWVVSGPLELRWTGGSLLQGGTASARAHPATDLCFTLHLDGQPQVSGAVVTRYSARLLRFPTLVRQTHEPQGEPATERYELHPHFPVLSTDPVSDTWSTLGQRQLPYTPP